MTTEILHLLLRVSRYENNERDTQEETHVNTDWLTEKRIQAYRPIRVSVFPLTRRKILGSVGT